VRIPIGAASAPSRTVVIDLPYIAVGAAAPPSPLADDRSRARAVPADATTGQSLQLLIQSGDITGAVGLWHQLVATLASDGSRDNAIEVQEGFTALVQLPLASASQPVRDQMGADVATWRNIDCGQLTFSISAIGTFDFSSDFAGYARRAADVLVWGRLTQDLTRLTGPVGFLTPVTCPAFQSDVSAPIRPSFPSYLAAANSALAQLSPVADFDTLLNTRLRQLLAFVANIEAFGGTDDLAAQVQSIAASQTVRLRAGAYSDCRTNRSQLKQGILLAKENGDVGFGPASPFESTDLISDIENCGMPIHWALLAADSSVLRQGDAGGIGPGNIVNAVPLALSDAAKLVLSGPLSALRCPSGTQNNEQLVLAAGPTSGTGSVVAQLTPSNGGYLEASNLEIPVSQLLALALPGGPSASGQLVMRRQGGLCNDEFHGLNQHAALVTFAINVGNLQITTTNLPPATVGTAFSVTLAVAGGVPPMVWSATGLPAGLGIDPQSGVISGTPASAGTAQVAVSVNDGDGAVAHETLSLDVRPTTVPAGRWNLTIHVDSGGVPGEPQLIAGTFLNQVSGQMGGTFSANFIADGFVNTLTPISGKLTATVGTDALGGPALKAVSITPLIDRTALRQANCQDVAVQIPGPVSENLRTLQFQTQDPSTGTDVVQISSLCGPFKYTGFDLTFSSP
jgi:Putative Ig domain